MDLPLRAQARRARYLRPARIRHFSASGALLLVLLGLVALIAAPYVYMALGAFKPTDEIFTSPITFWPLHPTLSNVYDLFTQFPVARWFVNTIIVAGCGTILQVGFSSLAGYAFAKLYFPLRNVLFTITLATTLIPFQVLLVPQFQLIHLMHGLNSYWALFIPGAVGAFNIFLMRQYTLSVPDDLLDAARVDGAGEFRIWWQMVLPAVKPGLAVVGILSFTNFWNDFFWPLVITTNPSMFVLNLGVASLIGPYNTEYGMVLAGALFASLPVIVLFLALQRYFIQGLTVGVVK